MIKAIIGNYSRCLSEIDILLLGSLGTDSHPTCSHETYLMDRQDLPGTGTTHLLPCSTDTSKDRVKQPAARESFLARLMRRRCSAIHPFHDYANFEALRDWVKSTARRRERFSLWLLSALLVTYTEAEGRPRGGCSSAGAAVRAGPALLTLLPPRAC